MSVDVGQPELDQSYCFKWSDYQNHLSGVVQQLLEEDYMVDVTLCAAGERIHAHRIVLSACSTLFQEILNEVNEDHPTIILSDISAQDIRLIVEFTYNGEISVPVENISNLLDAAHSLKIRGLMEIDGLDENETTAGNEDYSEGNAESSSVLKDEGEKEGNVLKTEYETVTESQEPNILEASYAGNRKRKRRRDTVKKDYSEDMLMSAIDDLRAGQTLIEAASRNNIPRSTLYMRAKALGIHLNASRNEYPPECMKAAMDAVIGGASLQQAAEIFSIPKTVLWRRFQKEGCQILRTEMRKTYDTEKREAAVKALERGENLTKVSLEFQIPKTTLFRDKTRLVDEGRLPLSFLKKRKTENEECKKTRLDEAVAACKGGKMSQATASMTYRIPKTTIWRRLQLDGKKHNRSTDDNSQQKEDNGENTSEQKQNDSQYAFCEVSSEIPITYIDESSIPEDSVIILTTEDVDGINLEEGRQIIVSSEPGHEYVPCALSIEDSSNYSTAES